MSEWIELLLEDADDAVGRGRSHVAVILSQIACELATETIVNVAIRRRDDEGLEDLVEALTTGRSWNLGNDRIRKAYTALTGDRIQEEGFWPRFIEHVQRRNQVVHGGYQPTQEEANDSYWVVSDLIAHIVEHMEGRIMGEMPGPGGNR